ncbi:MAG: nicotinate-nucleotide adenylyltransferase [Bacteroidaceae bacterium]|nr:nicotinate-nucleotide adenylyltransferase [Bacteroidaceae bacterium]
MPDKIRTAIYGGTYNPVHNGHLAVAKAVIESGMADELWLLVTPLNPFKKDQQLLPDTIRLQMAQLAVQGEPGIVASDFEFSLPKPSYTYNTLKALEKEYPERIFSLVMGADNWPKFRMWYQGEYLSSNYQIIIYPREGFDLPQPMPDNVHVLDCPRVDVSSTQIRERVREGLDIERLVPAAVARTIHEKSLYL